MSGILRWIKFGGQSQWHLRFGSEGAALCEARPGLYSQDGVTNTQPVATRWLMEGPPASRCPACLEVAALRLGIGSPR